MQCTLMRVRSSSPKAGVSVAKGVPSTPAASLVVVASLGAVATGTGGAPFEVVSDFADRLSGLVGLEVWAFTPHGTGDEQGEFSFSGTLEDIASVMEGLEASSVVLVGFGVVGRAMATFATARVDVAGVALLDPPVSTQGLRAELTGQGVRLSQRGLVGQDLESYSALEEEERAVSSPLLIVAGSGAGKDREDVITDISRRSRRAEVHRVAGAGDRLQDDPRTYAILLGWLERVVIPRYVRLEEPES